MGRGGQKAARGAAADEPRARIAASNTGECGFLRSAPHRALSWLRSSYFPLTPWLYASSLVPALSHFYSQTSNFLSAVVCVPQSKDLAKRFRATEANAQRAHEAADEAAKPLPDSAFPPVSIVHKPSGEITVKLDDEPVDEAEEDGGEEKVEEQKVEAPSSVQKAKSREAEQAKKTKQKAKTDLTVGEDGSVPKPEGSYKDPVEIFQELEKNTKKAVAKKIPLMDRETVESTQTNLDDRAAKLQEQQEQLELNRRLDAAGTGSLDETATRLQAVARGFVARSKTSKLKLLRQVEASKHAVSRA